MASIENISRNEQPHVQRCVFISSCSLFSASTRTKMWEAIRPEVEPDLLLSQLDAVDSAKSGDNWTVRYDLLELSYPSSQDGPGALLDPTTSKSETMWREKLNGEALREAFAARNSEKRLRIVFASNLQEEQEAIYIDPETRRLLQKELYLSVLFFHRIYFVRRGATAHIGNGLFSRRGYLGRIMTLYGFYPYRSGSSGRQSHLWFLHDVESMSSTYFIVQCPEQSKNRMLDMVFSGRLGRLKEPVAIDAIIASDYATLWAEDIMTARNDLLKFERLRISSTPNIDTVHAVEKLHDLSQRWHIFLGELDDFQDRLQSLLDISSKLPLRETEHATGESIAYLMARNRVWRRWVENYNERTKIRINLFFNLASQSDSRTNLEIAKLTSDIAIDTQKDSSSMITIAAVTMFFLPGTFVSAIFSMVFFNVNTDGQTLTVSPRWWYFLVVTVPLTILVFAVWLAWQRYRYRYKAKGNGVAPTL